MIIKKIMFLLLIIGTYSHDTLSQNVQINNVKLDDELYPNEPSIMMDPNNPNIMVVG